MRNGTQTGDAARLDVAARGISSPLEKTFLDIRVTHPNAPYQCHKPISSIYQDHERQKKRMYTDRILNVEKASFIPVVMTTFGGYGPEADTLVQRIAAMIAQKQKEKYSDVVQHVRNKLRFTMLKATLIAIRGFRGKPRTVADDGAREEGIDFNLIPNCDTFETL